MTETRARTRRWTRCVVLGAVVVLILVSACSGVPDGKAVLESRCLRCHGAAQIVDPKRSEEEWQSTIDRMVKLGARLNAKERAALVEYLVQ